MGKIGKSFFAIPWLVFGIKYKHIDRLLLPALVIMAAAYLKTQKEKGMAKAILIVGIILEVIIIFEWYWAYQECKWWM